MGNHWVDEAKKPVLRQRGH